MNAEKRLKMDQIKIFKSVMVTTNDLSCLTVGS